MEQSYYSHEEAAWIRRLSAGDVILYLVRKARREDIVGVDSRPNIYFAGSIASGRDEQPIYEAIIGMLSSYGLVLTQHGGNTRLAASGEENDRACAIYERTMRCLTQCKAMVAETTVPDFDVGYEVAKAEGLCIPILCLCRESPDHRLTAMADGNPFLRIVRYQHLSELDDPFRVFFEAARLAAIWRKSSL